MGWGDELMASGQARAIHARTGLRVQVLDRTGAVRSHRCWDGNPKIAQTGAPGEFERVVNGPSARPYHLEKRRDRWIYNPAFRAEVGELYFSPEEIAFGASYASVVAGAVVIEPTVKDKASPNKQWGEGRWLGFVELARRAGVRLVQLGPEGRCPLPGVDLVVTPDFRRGCAVLAHAQAYLGHEGGLHHAAAALGVPGVVLFGGFTPVELTGYALHRNLGVSFAGACGKRERCGHCDAEMARFTPAIVLAELEDVLEKHRRNLAA